MEKFPIERHAVARHRFLDYAMGDCRQETVEFLGRLWDAFNSEGGAPRSGDDGPFEGPVMLSVDYLGNLPDGIQEQ